MGRIISFINQKGGVGKTTMAFNMAHALIKSQKKVLLIDLDPQANLSSLFDIKNEINLYHLLVNSVRELKLIHTPALISDVMKFGTIDIIPAGQELASFDLTFSHITQPRQLILRRFLELNGLKQKYDYILIDCPPTLGLLVVNALCASSGVIVPFRSDDFSKNGLNHLYQVLDDIKEMGIVDVPKIVAHIPNLVDERRKIEIDKLNEINLLIDQVCGEGKVSLPFFNKLNIVKSLSKKKSIFEFNNKDFNEIQNQFLAISKMIESEDYGHNEKSF